MARSDRGSVGVKLKGHYIIECYNSDGELGWSEDGGNLVVDEGISHAFDNWLKGSAYTASFFVGLIDSAGFTSIVSGDTAASHAGWAESTAYSEATRQSLVLGSVTSNVIDNNASKAIFSINASGTIKGAFVITDGTKGGASGALISAKTFSADRSVTNGDTLNVQWSLSGSSS